MLTSFFITAKQNKYSRACVPRQNDSKRKTRISKYYLPFTYMMNEVQGKNTNIKEPS